MNPPGGLRRLVEQLQGAREIQVRILGDQAGDRMIGHRLRNQNGDGARVLHFVSLLGVVQESQVTGTGVFHARDALDLDLGIAHQRAPQRGGDIA